MKTFFVGDICSSKSISIPREWSKISLDSDLIVGNLEGAISEKSCENLVCNTAEILDFLETNRIGLVNLANNHVFDCESLFTETILFLQKKRISFLGAGNNLEQASRPFEKTVGKTKLLIFSYGWDVIGCKPANGLSCGVNPFVSKNLFEVIHNVRKMDNEAVVVFLFHWNFELELYPQPMYRQIARDLIDAGVDAIIGNHPHVAQGAEVYNGKPIVYSLGNWFFPPRKLENLDLRFPEIANLQLALELNFSSRDDIDAKLHWFIFQPTECEIVYKSTEKFDGEILKALTPFENMTHKDYCAWFKLNRRKSFLLPIYKDYKQVCGNYLKDIWVVLRQRAIDFLLKLKLKSPPS